MIYSLALLAGVSLVGAAHLSSIATMMDYPGSTGNGWGLGGPGMLTMAPFEGDGIAVSGRLSGFPVSSEGGVHVHVGFNCDEVSAPGGHFWTGAGADPWNVITEDKWTSDANGMATVDFSLNTVGFSYKQSVGRVAVMHNQAGDRIACGKLLPEVTTPTYWGMADLMPLNGTTWGFVQVSVDTDGNATIWGNANLMDINGSWNGAHIHEGTSCDPALHGGHYFTNGADDWIREQNQVTSEDGTRGWIMATASAGLTLPGVLGKVVILHDSTYAKVACGVIRIPPQPVPRLAEVPDMAVAVIGTYPGSTGTPKGTLTITPNNGPAGFQIVASLSGLPPSSSGGMHVHVGTSCETDARVGGHFWSVPPTGDIWTTWTTDEWTSDADGMASFTWTGLDGQHFQNIIGRTMTLHDNAGARIGCGVIQPGPRSAPHGPYGSVWVKEMAGAMGPYQGHFVILPQATPDMPMLSVQGHLTGMDDVGFAGVHIHVGTDCAAPGAHYFSVDDAWLDIKYWTDGSGARVRHMAIDVGLNVTDVVGRTLVLHNTTGAKVACGVIAAAELATSPTTATPTSAPSASEAPSAPTGATSAATGRALSVSAAFAVAFALVL